MRVGNYTLSDILGRGGSSEVYAATHAYLGDKVAVKLLRAPIEEDTAVRDEFLAEAARTREIQHPNVVRVIDFGHDPLTHACYLVMERIVGETLASRIRRTTISEAVLRELGAAIADGMQAAHERGIVHRDLKPGNVMLRGNVPTIVDFGIAKSLGAASAAVTERRVGTVAYMAPEQLTDGLITPAVDIWALGVILYEAATGKPPFAAFSDGRLPQLFDSPKRPGSIAPISGELDDLIMRCLARDPGRRPASMTDLARGLREPFSERVTEDLGARVELPPAPSRFRWWIPVVLVLATGVIGVSIWKLRDGSEQVPKVEEPAVAPVKLEPKPSEPPAAHVEAPAKAPPTSPPTERKPTKRTKQAKPKTTRQGETLD